MQEVEGIILIISCQKHKDTRLKEFKLPKDDYSGWKVIYVLGDLQLESPYSFDGNILTIKCEDSYIHLLKKVVLSMQILQENFRIKQGILRCGDDLKFNEDKLIQFLTLDNKRDYMGRCLGQNVNHYKINTQEDHFMLEYYNSHKEDYENTLHNLKNVDISRYVKRPIVPYISGVLLYVSNKASNILIKHMKNIEYNIFSYDLETESYPYCIEDCGIGFIMYKNKITPTGYLMYSDYQHDSFEYIGYHTNKYR
jgi:hypothetical protein